MILAAGVGSRLGELTQTKPKCLMMAGGKTMLEHVAARLKQAGITEVVVNVHHHASSIESYVRSHDSLGLRVEFSHEETLLGTGGGLQKVQPFFAGQEFFYLYNSDIYCDLDLQRLLAGHRSQAGLGVLAVMERPESSYLLFNACKQFIGWEKPGGERALVREDDGQAEKLAFCGIQILSPKIFEYMRDQEPPFSIIQTYLAASAQGENLYGQPLNGEYWVDVGTPERLKLLNQRLRSKT